MNWLKFGRVFSWIESRWLRIAIILLAASTMLWMAVLGEGNFASKFFRGLFFSLQFIVLNKDIDPGIDPLPFSALTFAQFALPFTVSVALIGSLFQERMMPYWVRRAMAQLDGHHVIIGYGGLGKRLASELVDAGSTVLVVDLSAQTTRMTEMLFMLQHDALQPTLMGAVNFERAAAIYLLLPDERDNLALLDSIVAKSDQLQNKPKIHVRFQSRHLGRLFADLAGHKGSAARSRLDIRPFNPFDLAARGLINSFAPDLYGNIDREGSITQTVMIVGTSAIAESILLRLARIGIYSPRGKLRVIWAGDGTSDAFARLSADYPALNPNAYPKELWGDTSGASPAFFELQLPPIKVETIDAPAALSVRSGWVAKQCDHQLPAAVYVCHDSDVSNAIEARDLQVALSQRLPLPTEGGQTPQRLILAVQGHTTLGVANTPAAGRLAYQIEEETLDAVFAKTMVTDRADRLAMGYHAVYADPSIQSWLDEPFFVKESNRDLADHLAIKARYAGIDAKTVTQIVFDGEAALSEEGVEQLRQVLKDLERMEQRRYRAFMFMNGFSHGRKTAPGATPKGQKEIDRSLRLNQTLLTENLSDHEKAKDSKIVEESIAALSKRHA